MTPWTRYLALDVASSVLDQEDSNDEPLVEALLAKMDEEYQALTEGQRGRLTVPHSTGIASAVVRLLGATDSEADIPPVVARQKKHTGHLTSCGRPTRVKTCDGKAPLPCPHLADRNMQCNAMDGVSPYPITPDTGCPHRVMTMHTETTKP